MYSWPSRILVAALFIGVASLVEAQSPPVPHAASVPRVVRVDGQFVPASGLPPAAVETVTLALYASESDATPLWEEMQEVRVDAQGRYAVFLGATTAEGLPVSLLAAGDLRWLGIRFARPGETEPARVPLTSVPYALRASDADTLGGLPASAFLRAEGAPDGASTPADGAAATGGPRGPAPRVSTGTPNYLGKFTNAVDLTSSALYDNAGRIGLGTTTPLDFLHARFSDTTGAFTGYAVQNLGSGASSYSGMLFYDQNGALGQFQGFNNSTHEYRINNIAPGGTINFMIGATSRFQVRNDGDIEAAGSIRKGGTSFLTSMVVESAGLGFGALANNTGSRVNAVGSLALGLATNTGPNNNAFGADALRSNTSGTNNVAVGDTAMGSNASGGFNTALGDFALAFNTSGSANIAIGATAGANIILSNNIVIGNLGTNTDSNTIRIGGASHTRFFAGGVRNITTGMANAVGVLIDTNGQLGTASSSRRYKEDIQDMGDASSGLMKLRPVTYRYRQAFANGTKPIDYGLIAEEVEQVYPDVVAHLANGEVETVQYHKINAMLLNEVQKQHRQIGDLEARLAALERLLTSDKQ